MIVHRAIFRELTKNLGVIVFCISILLFMEKFVKLTRLFMGKGADFHDIVKAFLYLQPSILLLSIPMAILIATFLTYGRMASDSELIVLKGSGMGFWGISRASVILSILCFSVLLFISLYVLPRSMYSLKHTLHETMIKKASMTFEEGAFSDVFNGTVIFVKNIPSKDDFRGIFIYKEGDTSMDEPVMIVAESGTIKSNPAKGLLKLIMSKGLIHSYKENKSSEIYFSEYDFVLSTGLESPRKTKADEIKTSDLWKDRKKSISWEIELHRRLALPFAGLILGLLAPALANRIGKIGRLGGFSLSISILIFYYMLLIMGEAFSKSEKISPFLGGWGPDLIFGTVTVFFFYKAYMDKPIRRV
jgi:lipopolysaccharide export system permease protein